MHANSVNHVNYNIARGSKEKTRIPAAFIVCVAQIARLAREGKVRMKSAWHKLHMSWEKLRREREKRHVFQQHISCLLCESQDWRRGKEN